MRGLILAAITALLTSWLVSPAAAELVQRHGDGSLWTYDGQGKCANSSCPGWTEIDHNGATKDAAAGFGGLYQLQTNGQIWRYDGVGHCQGAGCGGWAQVDHNAQTKDIAGGRAGFFQLHANGEIWKYDGHGQCTAKQCPGWTQIDKNAATQSILAGPTVYQMHADHGLWRYDGVGHCDDHGCPGWAQVDVNPGTAQAAANTVGLYQRLTDGKIYKYDGHTLCAGPSGPCSGWILIDRNAATQQIVAGGRGLYQFHADHSLWKYDGTGRCDDHACPGWAEIDKNAATAQVAADSGVVYQRHGDGQLWKYDGVGVCDDRACPGWTLIDKNTATSIVAFDPAPGPALGNLAAGLPVNSVKVVLDSTGAVIFSANPFGSAKLCAAVVNPPPPKIPLDKTILAKAVDKANSSPFKAHSESHVTLGPCTGGATILATGSSDLHLLVAIPGNRLHLRLTTPDAHVLGVSIGLPGGVDPDADIGFDIAVQADIRVPRVSGTDLKADNATAGSANTRILHKNLSADALTVVNDIVHFFGGPNFLSGLTSNQTVQADQIGDFLASFNAQLRQFPPGVALVASYDAGSATLFLRTTQ